MRLKMTNSLEIWPSYWFWLFSWINIYLKLVILLFEIHFPHKQSVQTFYFTLQVTIVNLVTRIAYCHHFSMISLLCWTLYFSKFFKLVKKMDKELHTILSNIWVATSYNSLTYASFSCACFSLNMTFRTCILVSMLFIYIGQSDVLGTPDVTSVHCIQDVNCSRRNEIRVLNR